MPQSPTRHFVAGLLTMLAACAAPSSERPSSATPPTFEDFGVVQVLSDGDYDLPRFGAGGDRLAVVERLRVDDVPTFNLWLQHLASGDREILIDGREALAWAAYGAFPIRLEWRDDTITVSVSDGDVGRTEVDIELESRRLTESFLEAGVDPLSVSQQALATSLRALQPDWPQLLVDHVARGAMAIAPSEVLFQKRYSGEDHHLWHLDLSSGVFTRVLSIPDDRDLWLEGRVSVVDRAVLVFRERAEFEVYLIDRTTPLDSLAFAGPRGMRSLTTVGAGDGWALVQAELSSLDGLPQNPVFAVTPDSLYRWASEPGLVELRLSSGVDQLAVVLQSDDQRHVEIRER